jgi:hypothetical protein
MILYPLKMQRAIAVGRVSPGTRGHATSRELTRRASLRNASSGARPSSRLRLIPPPCEHAVVHARMRTDRRPYHDFLNQCSSNRTLSGGCETIPFGSENVPVSDELEDRVLDTTT